MNNKMIHSPYYPEDIAYTLDKLTFGMNDTQDLTEAIYWIKNAAENPYNHDYWRTLYQVLSELVYNHESGRIMEEV